MFLFLSLLLFYYVSTTTTTTTAVTNILTLLLLQHYTNYTTVTTTTATNTTTPTTLCYFTGDLGSMALGVRMVVALVPYDFLAGVFSFAAPYMGDYQKHNKNRGGKSA